MLSDICPRRSLGHTKKNIDKMTLIIDENRRDFINSECISSKNNTYEKDLEEIKKNTLKEIENKEQK